MALDHEHNEATSAYGIGTCSKALVQPFPGIRDGASSGPAEGCESCPGGMKGTVVWLRARVVSDFEAWMHRLEVAITRGAEGKAKRAFVGHLNEEKSLELASKIAGEGFVFMVMTYSFNGAPAKGHARKGSDMEQTLKAACVRSYGSLCFVEHTMKSSGSLCDVKQTLKCLGSLCDVEQTLKSVGKLCDVEQLLKCLGSLCDVEQPLKCLGSLYDVEQALNSFRSLCDA
eukprot:scaffold10987_cov19-Tisochrysis_lutea.AAC.2